MLQPDCRKCTHWRKGYGCTLDYYNAMDENNELIRGNISFKEISVCSDYFDNKQEYADYIDF